MNIVQCVVEEHGKLPSKFEFATSNRTCTAYFVAVGVGVEDFFFLLKSLTDSPLSFFFFLSSVLPTAYPT
jgi:hypothetical protein